MALLRLFDPTTQFQTKSGALNVAGKLRVYVERTDDLANIYGDDVSLLSQPLILDSNGRARDLFVDSGRSYRLEVYDRNDSLLFTIRRMEPNASGTIISQTVFIKGTPDEIDVEDSVTEKIRTYTVSLSATVTGKIDENRKAIDAVNYDVVNLSQSVGDVKDNLNNLAATVGSNATQIGQLKTDVESIESSLANKKDKQTELNFNGSATKTIKSITQNTNGEINVEYEDIDLPQEVPNVEITSVDNSIDVVESTDSQTNTKTYDLSVADSIKSKIKDITITDDTLVIIGD